MASAEVVTTVAGGEWDFADASESSSSCSVSPVEGAELLVSGGCGSSGVQSAFSFAAAVKTVADAAAAAVLGDTWDFADGYISDGPGADDDDGAGSVSC